MTAERESMTWRAKDGRSWQPRAMATPDPEVVAKPKRRKFTAQYRLRILEEAESCTQPGEVHPAASPFRGVCTAPTLTEWRRARREGSLQAPDPESKRGRKPAERNPLSAKVHERRKAKVARPGEGRLQNRPYDPGRLDRNLLARAAGIPAVLEHGKDC